jgi:hypothetical protein
MPGDLNPEAGVNQSRTTEVVEKNEKHRCL